MTSEDATAASSRYGCGAFRPAWLQWLNNIVGAVTFLSIANLLLNFADGLLGVVMSTIERRFDLSSSQSSWMASGYEFGAVPALILISVFGTRWAA
jgi:Organic Anion Transporter Polypeptide (OATP) family